MFGGHAIPTSGLGIVLLDTFALVIEFAKYALHLGIALRGHFAIPTRGLGEILRHTLALFIGHGYVILHGDIALHSELEHDSKGFFVRIGLGMDGDLKFVWEHIGLVLFVVEILGGLFLLHMSKGRLS